MDKYEALKQYFGHEDFREGQAELIDSILQGRDVLGIMPTGAGKSMCYQIPSLLMDGTAIVISPLISLMKDQVGSLLQSGISAAYINSSLSFAEYSEVYENALSGAYKIIYAAPERLVTDDFIALSERIKISVITVDEAHCVSQWGQDFRPSYLKIIDYVKRLSYRPVIGAFTATATKEVREDIAKILQLNNPFVVTTGFDRKNLYFAVEQPKDKLSALLKILKKEGEKSGIVYCSTRKNVEAVCQSLNENGFSATRYHAGLGDEERRKNQDDFIYDRKTVMVATNAFGMGIDKSNVSFVIHYNMPKSIEGYYQEAGRAGRDGEPADCIMLYSASDVNLNKFLIEKGGSNEELTPEMRRAVMEKDLERLKFMTFYCTTNRCLRAFILSYFGDKSPAQCGACSNCDGESEETDITLAAQKIISCVYRLSQRRITLGKAAAADVLHGSKSAKILSLGLDTLSTYGIMSETPLRRIREYTDYLLENNYLSADGEFGTLSLLPRSDEIIKEKKKLVMKRVIAQTAQDYDYHGGRKPVSDENVDEKLFGILKQLRASIVRDLQVPAYIIFPDSALKDMCRKKPKTEAEFLGVAGVGEARAKRYGKQFIEAIKQYDNGETTIIPTADKANFRKRIAAKPKSEKSYEIREIPPGLREDCHGGMSIGELSEKYGYSVSEICNMLKRL